VWAGATHHNHPHPPESVIIVSEPTGLGNALPACRLLHQQKKERRSRPYRPAR
jgi:hypothetical protein